MKHKTWMSTLFKYSRLIILALLFGFFSLATKTFFSVSNLDNFKNIVAQQVPFLIILSIGMTIAILLKGIDLSIGAVLALSSCIAALVLRATQNILLCIAAGLATGAVFGAFNGLLIARVGLSPYIATYTVQWVSKGVAFVLLGGSQIFNFPAGFRELFTGWFYTLLIISLAVAALLWVLMSKTTFGRNVYAVGNNAEAARLSGVNVPRVYVLSFTLIGLLAALTGLMYIANLGAAEPVIGDNFAIQAIAATLIGGTSFGGGKGSVANAVVGACIMTTLTNGLLHLGVHSYWQQFAIGVVIVLSILLERFAKRYVRD